jgi:hypothetical protein
MFFIGYDMMLLSMLVNQQQQGFRRKKLVEIDYNVPDMNIHVDGGRKNVFICIISLHLLVGCIHDANDKSIQFDRKLMNVGESERSMVFD